MTYPNLESCLQFLEQQGQLIRVKEEVDPYLEMASVHLRVHEAGGPALLFEKVKGSPFRAASNIFGTLNRSKLIFGNNLLRVKQLSESYKDPMKILRSPLKHAPLLKHALTAVPQKISNPAKKFFEIKVSDLPLIHHWPMDGGAFVTLPQVYTEPPDGNIWKANIGMYRIQLNGNDYVTDEEVGLHYQIHRGIGVHQEMWNRIKKPMKVSVFVGGPPAHTVAAVMPLPEGMSEAAFAGSLAAKRFRYGYVDGYAISADADFVLTGEVPVGDTKPEGPFGDHLGYYSLKHPFPVMRIHKVFAKPNGIWPFTVVGRPPQEDTRFGELIHEITGDVLPGEIPGLKSVHAVDASGVHPLLLAVGSERYTPYDMAARPAEILTIANRILGTGQLSLAKFLFITASATEAIDVHNLRSYFNYVLSRFLPQRDLHFFTNTTIDTLDYSGSGLNTGSKLVIAAYGDEVRKLENDIPACLDGYNPQLIMPGVVAIQLTNFTNYETAAQEMNVLSETLTPHLNALKGIPMLVVADDAEFVAENMRNFLWVTFTRCNPSHDVHGINSFIEHKHWGCNGPLVFDARIKPHHAPPLKTDPETEKRVDKLFAPGGSLHGIA